MPTDQNDESWFITSLARGLRLLEAFRDESTPLSVSELARHCGISRAAARRIAMTLEAIGYLGRTEHNKYQLMPRVLTLGTAYLSSHRIEESVQPILAQLRDQTQLSASLSVLDGQDIVYVARAAVAGPMRIHVMIGQRLPAYATAMGRVLLTGLSEQALASWLADARLERLTRTTLTHTADLRAAIEEARVKGYCIVDGEIALGIKVIAVPVTSIDGSLVAALNLTTQAAFEPKGEDPTRFLPLLREAAREIQHLTRFLPIPELGR